MRPQIILVFHLDKQLYLENQGQEVTAEISHELKFIYIVDVFVIEQGDFRHVFVRMYLREALNLPVQQAQYHVENQTYRC